MLLDFILPMPCILCKRSPKPICEVCVNKLTVQLRQSQIAGVTGYSFCRYDSELSVILNAIKENNLTSLVKPLVGNLASEWPTEFRDTYLVPIPSSFANRRKRGFSHNSLLIKEFVKLVPELHFSEVLFSARKRLDQAGLDAEQRAINMSDAFKVGTKVEPNRKYVLFDDIVTTGATLSQAIGALRSAGIEPAGYVVLARSGA